MATRRLTMAQALVEFLTRQHVERDGAEQRFFAGCFAIFGHGNVAGIGQALQQVAGLRTYPSRNEQAMVHAAAAYARMKDRLSTFACTSSIGPGATNMLTAAAGATINRLPVLLLPGDTFARRNVAPVLQQLESERSQDVSVNDCFRPVSRYWDRITRPEQILTALPEAMRVLTSPSETGAVTLCLPQDVQTEAHDYPEELFARRVWRIPRPRPEAELVARAAELVRKSARPLIVAGGGVIYSGACDALDRLARATGIPVAETQAGKGSLAFDHPQSLGAVGATGTLAANRAAADADLVIGIGTRYSDFTSASKTAFQHPSVRFININVASFDAHKHAALPVVADARAALEELAAALVGHRVAETHRARIESLRREWDAELDRLLAGAGTTRPAQAEVIAEVHAASGPRDVVVCAAGSMPGDLHKLWRARDPKGYHVEYGYSCMGYEIAGGLGVAMADPGRAVTVMVGDASYLMMAQEIVTAVQEGVTLCVVVVDNHGYASIGALSASVGSDGFACATRRRGASGELDGDVVAIDFAANARSLGAHAAAVSSRAELAAALAAARARPGVSVIAVETDPSVRVGGYDSWWDVPVAEVSEMDGVAAARAAWEESVRKERHHL
ncbi:MAG TPA: 3D-(3,5/4)-trihydroxycyclohexane-1,2-dione acylhydrolase (decyclizing) [Kofleriaceae bacterium]|nr:3D-(3,5/4)-trihydroxycyclohexane-1,2-dione acylhydrolase (decyclizing) [Kofleriaceae bacterium]